MIDPFAITERPVPVPAGAESVDVGAELARLLVRCGKLEDRLQDERRRSLDARRELLLGLLDVCDALERLAGAGAEGSHNALERQRSGIDATQRLLRQRLARAGVVAMHLAGRAADPTMADVEGGETHPGLPDDTVVRELTVGYWCEDDVLRRARVIVSRRARPGA